jgi:hypothetical protein
MLQIIFLNIGLCVILLAIAFVFKKYARVILWSSAITLFVGTLLLVGLGIVNPVSDNETGSSEFWGTIMFLISVGFLNKDICCLTYNLSIPSIFQLNRVGFIFVRLLRSTETIFAQRI